MSAGIAMQEFIKLDPIIPDKDFGDKLVPRSKRDSFL